MDAWTETALHVARLPWPVFVDSWERADPETGDDLLRMRFRYDRARFLQYCFPALYDRPFNPYHRAVLNRPRVHWRERRGRIVRRADAAPRGIAKTTLLKGELVHVAVYGLEAYIVILSAESRLAEAIVGHLFRIFTAESSPLAKLYGPFQVRGGIQGFTVTFPDGHSVGFLPRSFGQQVRGANEDAIRPTLIVVDDGERPDRVRNPEQRRLWWDFLHEDVLKAGPIEGGLLVELRGTVLHPDSILARILKHPGWAATKWQACKSWPERMDLWERCGEIWKDLTLGDEDTRRACALAFYEANRAEMDRGVEMLDDVAMPVFRFFEVIWGEGLRSVLKDLQNEPRDAATSFFDAAKFKRCRVEGETLITSRGKRIPLSSLRMGMYLDPIPGQNLGTLADDGGAGAGDFAAIAVAGIDEHRNGYLLDVWMRRCRDTDILVAMWALGERWRVRRARIEANGFGRFVTRDFRRAQEERRKKGLWADLVIDQADVDEDKDERIAGLEVPLTNGWLEVAEGIRQDVLGQFDDFPNGDHDDGPDAVAGVYRLLDVGPPSMGQARVQ